MNRNRKSLIVVAMATAMLLFGAPVGSNQSYIVNNFVVNAQAATVEASTSTPTVIEGDATLFNSGKNLKNYYREVSYSEVNLTTKSSVVPIKAFSPNTDMSSPNRTFTTTNSRMVIDAVAFAKALGYEDTKYDKNNKIFYTRGLISYNLKEDKYTMFSITDLSKDIFDICGVEIGGEIYLPIEVLSYAYNLTNNAKSDKLEDVIAWDRITKDNPNLNFNIFTINGKDIDIFKLKESDLKNMFGNPDKIRYSYFTKEYIYGKDMQSQIKTTFNPRGELVRIVVAKSNTKYLGINIGDKISDSKIDVVGNFTLAILSPQSNIYRFNMDAPVTKSIKSINSVNFGENSDPSRRGYINVIVIDLIVG